MGAWHVTILSDKNTIAIKYRGVWQTPFSAITHDLIANTHLPKVKFRTRLAFNLEVNASTRRLREKILINLVGAFGKRPFRRVKIPMNWFDR